MNEKRAIENDFKCGSCKGPLAKVGAEKRARYKIGQHYGCFNPNCWYNFDQVFYRIKLGVTPKGYL